MRTKFFIAAISLTTTCLAQIPDSTSIKNQQLIEQLKNRINTIDNIGNGTNAFQKQIDEMKIELARQNDSIVKLLNIINGLKQYAATNNIGNNSSQNEKSSLTLNSENETSLQKNKSNKENKKSKQHSSISVNANNEGFVSSKSLNDNDYNELSKSEASYQNYISTCNCIPLLYKPYQVELNFKTIAQLDEVIKNYEINSNNKITIVGHADKTGDESTNISLSKQRAENLKNYLIIASEKIKKVNISIEWKGSSAPIKNLSENRQELNRRTEITLQ